MNKSSFSLLIAVACLGVASAHATPVVFTNNTAISPINPGFDGADIVVSNCTVTVDGAHGFNSVLVTAGGVLTHSYFPSGNAAPSVSVTNESQVLAGFAPVTLLNTNVSGLVTVTDNSSLITYSNGVDYAQTNLGDGTTQIYRLPGSAIPDPSTVLVSYTWNYSFNPGLYLTVTNDVVVAVGGSINANGIGYGPATGPGAGQTSIFGGSFHDGAGAGYGGFGGFSFTNGIPGNPYGSLYQPAALGSGGGGSYAGNGGTGGGLVQISTGGNVDIEGLISANGLNATNARAGGGAGGSIWITATNFSGAGSLTANGGAGASVYGGGGGGGRISIQCGTNNFTGSFTVIGGNGAKIGGAGSVFIQTNGQIGLLLVDNGGRTGGYSAANVTNTTDVLVTNGATFEPNYFSNFSVRNVTVATNSALGGAAVTPANLTITGNLIIQAGGALISLLGTTSGNGVAPGIAYTGGGSPYPCGGGGHAGYGGAGFNTNATGGANYDSETAPTAPGSGGGNFTGANPPSIGGFGGGVIQLNIAGTLQVDGTISVNGEVGFGAGGGGGAGGSIYIASCTTFSGTGSLTANGGNGVAGVGGGGGGGRIAIIATTSFFTGSLSAIGGSGANYGGAGTIYTQFQFTNSVGGPPPLPQLILDNGGNLGNLTPVQSSSGSTLTIRNGARGTATSSVSFNSLLVSSNGWLSHVQAGSLNLIINGNATIQPGGGFLGDSLGRIGGQGIAAGGGNQSAAPYYPGGGGGYGGAGGNAITNTALGGTPVGDTAANPSSTYSGSGGGTVTTTSIGGSGGGFLQLTVSGTLQLNGLVSANGGNGSGLGGGGGAGGGVSLNVGTFAGGGAINVNGGAGANGFGGGGGGGRIAIYFNNNNFTGTLSALGGNGANYGGAGTIYIKTNSAGRGQVIVDNAGHPGANTPWSSTQSTDLILRNGGSTYVSGNTTFGNITVGTNSVLVASNGSPSSATINAFNVTVQPGGAISGDVAGYNPGNGNGPGGYNGNTGMGGGGAHGGYGANSVSNLAFGGTYYDNPSSPGSAGSGGGGPLFNVSAGGRGGGVITMNASGNLQVDGTLSANGGNGSGAGGGGGAGGTLNLSCITLTGGGVIAANGGSGVSTIGGGGAGGMIRAQFTSNLFSGTILAAGGNGANFGGAGTIYFQTNNGQSLLIIDNGGHRGTNTPLASANNYTLRNGATAFQALTSPTINSLLIASNAWLLPNNGGTPGTVNLTVNGNATIQPGGVILADASGSIQNVGGGHGGTFGAAPLYPCGGGGHGGFGAAGYTNAGAGGPTYDTTANPVTTGSGGGGLNNSIGGNGGGYVKLTVTGTLQLNGSITANGGNGGGTAGGGGSGGGIVLSPSTLIGNGIISANGGNGANGFGGGGGGGRIAINFNSDTFTGNISAFGGSGYNYGGAGTIYTKTNSQIFGQVLLDNGNNSGTNTTFDFNIVNITVQNRAIGVLPSSGTWSPNNIFIRTNSALIAPVSANGRTLSAANNLTINAGGAFSLDGAGNISQTGTGSGYPGVSFRGGGGHGGSGGGNPAGNGKAYDSIPAPVSVGSGGGSYQNPPYDQGGYGGGEMTVSVNGTLTVNGRLSANGGSGDNYAGGGSGGSLYLQNIGTLAGNGVISANGGSGGGAGGGGGGGRIALYATSSTFTGKITAYGGSAFLPGGAGTVYIHTNGGSLLLVDNGGIAGTNTPLGSIFTMPANFDLDISGDAIVVPFSPLPLLNNLNLTAGSTLTIPVIQSNLVIVVKNNATIAGSLTVDDLGYGQTNGPGAGSTVSSESSGGGYGGAGGNSDSGAIGGITYGSASQPVDFGSGGGGGDGAGTVGSQGGGAVRLSVGGTLSLNGNLSANGNFAQQDYAGGGAGGSLWISANTLTGAGTISAAGGDGDLFGGGGGGGGRIAIYCPTNLFSGITNAGGGFGAMDGQPGTIFLSSALPNFLVLSQSPTGTVSNTVSSVDLTFSEAVDPASVSASAFTITTPAGVLPTGNVAATSNGPTTVHVSFPLQNLNGIYSIQATTITNILGTPLTSPYTGNFTILLPVISGTVSDTNGAPVAGVTLQPDGGLAASVSDSNGNYSIDAPPGWNGTITPSLGTLVFVPHARTYANVAASIANENYLAVPTIAPNLASSLSNTNVSVTWTGISGVTYQVWISQDLINWQPYGDTIPGTNGLMQIQVPDNYFPSQFGYPAVFLRISASN